MVDIECITKNQKEIARASKIRLIIVKEVGLLGLQCLKILQTYIVERNVFFRIFYVSQCVPFKGTKICIYELILINFIQ